MSNIVKPTTDQDLIDAFLAKGGEVKKGKTKPLPMGLGLSKGQWGNTLSKEEKEARDAEVDMSDLPPLKSGQRRNG